MPVVYPDGLLLATTHPWPGTFNFQWQLENQYIDSHSENHRVVSDFPL